MTTHRRELPETGLPEEDLPDRALLERIWSILSRWAVPVMMSLAYVLLAATSDTNTTGKLLMATGLALVFVGWFVFRALTESAGLSRALSVGDVPRLRAIARRRGARTPAARSRRILARAVADLLRGEFAGAVDASAVVRGRDAGLPPELELLAEVVYVAALIEEGAPIRRMDPAAAARGPSSVAEARKLLGLAPAATAAGAAAGTAGVGRPGAAAALASLSEGQLALIARDLDAAATCFARVVDDIRAGSLARAMAHLHSARLAHGRGDCASAERHRIAAAALASPDASWLRPPPPPPPRAD